MKRHLLATGLVMLAALPAAAHDLPPAERTDGLPVALDCQAALAGAQVRWQVELLDSLPLAVVDGDDAPAHYGSSHAQVRLAADGPSLFIGRVTGRLVVSDGSGATLGSGRCTRLLTV